MTAPSGDGAALTATSAAVLGMVALGARSGYDIRRAAERSVRFFWALGPPQVYAELKRLEATGLVRGRDEPRGNRARRTFEVTAAGREALERWLGQDDAAPLELRDVALLRLFFADAMDRRQALEHLERMRSRSDAALAQFRREILPAAAQARDAGAAFPEHVARFGVELHAFIAAWCERLHAELEAEDARG